MVVVIHLLYRILSSAKRMQKVKPYTLHCSLLVLVFIYAFVGGLIFNKLEAQATQEQYKKLEVLEQVPSSQPLDERPRTDRILHCFQSEPDHRSQWSWITGTLYSFGIITTLGYNRIGPITLAGRLFCVFYGICGIPLTMIIETYREKRRRSRVTGASGLSASEEEIEDSSVEFMSLGLLISFLFYVCLGAFLLPLLNGEATIDFGQLVPSKWEFLPITFLYVCIGLAITTIAIEIGSEYLKKLHHFGKRMKNVAQTRIWFGGKTLKVRDLLHAVGKKCGIDPSEIDKLDLENVIERAVAISEGREPPMDTNEEPPPPKEPQPPATEEVPLLENNRNEDRRSRTPPFKRAAERVVSLPIVEQTKPIDNVNESLENSNRNLRLDLCEFVAIDMDLPDGPIEEALTWMEPVQIDPAIASPKDLGAYGPPHVIVDEDERILDLEPRKFKEKKEKYGRDAKRLYETYQEEWERLVLALNALGSGTGGRRESSLEGSTSTARESPAAVRHAQQTSPPSATRITKEATSSPSELRKQTVPKQEVKITTSPTNPRIKSPTMLRAGTTPKVLRPPVKENMERRSSSPRKLDLTRFSKFGEMVTKPDVPGLEERILERRKSRMSNDITFPPETPRKSLTGSDTSQVHHTAANVNFTETTKP
ncbi:unnamed protein product [Meloidogyne enterolobii]|uniref:Uncharacterized protein n=1 Tax=Meloidogyne enterolobii TaxID=390850 RepID=A0ACB1AG21_MELEN